MLLQFKFCLCAWRKQLQVWKPEINAEGLKEWARSQLQKDIPPYSWSLLPPAAVSQPSRVGLTPCFSFHVWCWMFLECHSLLFSLLTLKQTAKIKHKVQGMFMSEVPSSCRGMSDMWTCMPQKSMRCKSCRAGRLSCDGKDLTVLLVPCACLEAGFATTKGLPAGLVRS